MNQFQLKSWLALFAFMICGCMKPKDEGTKTSDLVPHYSVVRYSDIVWCEFYFTRKSDASQTIVPLEDDDLATCNGQKMQSISGFMYKGFTYQPGTDYTIMVLRAIDGSVAVSTTNIP